MEGNMARAGIICASDDELKPFLPHIQECDIAEKAMLRFYQGKINGMEVVALYSGVCKTNAAIAAQILIDSFNVDMIINAGTAGGMADNVKLFDTVVATESAYHDVEEDVLTEFHPWMESVFFKSDAGLLALLEKIAEAGYPRADCSRAGKIHFGRMITGEAFITDNGRDEINAAFSPLSVDMETASIAHVCHVNQIPFAAVRCITDTAEHSGIGNFEENCAAASEIAKDIVVELLGKLAKQNS